MCAFLRDVLFARPDELSSRAISKSKPREKAGGRYAADLFLQPPARGSGSAAILCTEFQSKRRVGCCALGGQHRLNRYHRGTADSIVRRYGANVRREVRITESGCSQLYADLLITKCRAGAR